MRMGPNVFTGITVLGFSWAMVGALTMKLLADYGATVIRIETARRPDVSRISSPYKDGKPGINRSGYFSHFSANMLDMALNMAHPLASGIARKLVSMADVVCENFTPGIMEKWGLSYEELVKIKPDIIMLRQSGFGSTGPYRDRAAFGMTLAAISGIPNFIGWPDREPLPVGVGAYTDCISPRYALAALIAALDHRDKTGRGSAHRACPVRDRPLLHFARDPRLRGKRPGAAAVRESKSRRRSPRRLPVQGRGLLVLYRRIQ